MPNINLTVEPYSNINEKYIDVFYSAKYEFERVYNKNWFLNDDFLITIVEEIDNCKHLIQDVFTDQFNNNITPLLMSDGLKQLIMIYKFPEYLYDIKLMGDNCINLLPKIAERVGDLNLVYYEAPRIPLDNTNVKAYFTNKNIYTETEVDTFVTAIKVRNRLMEKEEIYQTYFDRFLIKHKDKPIPEQDKIQETSIFNQF